MAVSSYPYGASGQLQGDPAMTPTYQGRQSGVGVVVDSTADDYKTSPSSATADTTIWVEFSTTETWIRVTGNASGNVISDVNWYNTSSVNQGAPGADQNVMVLGMRADTFNIYTSAVDIADNGATRTKLGTPSWTDDDQITFPSNSNVFNGVNYGYRVNCESSAAPGVDSDNASMTLQITLRKAGYADLVTTWSTVVDTAAEGDY